VATRWKLMDLQAPGGAKFTAFNPDSTWLASGENGDVNIWDLTTGKKLYSLSVPFKFIWWLKFSPDGTLLAVNGVVDNITGFDHRILIWDMDTRVDHLADPVEIKAFLRNLGQFKFSPDGASLVASGLDGAMVFDVNTGARILQIPGYGVGSQMSMYSSDGIYIIACWDDGHTRIYEAQTGVELLDYKFPGNFWDGMVAFTPDEKEIVSLGSEGYFQKFIFLNFPDLVAIARSRLTRTWTQEECRKYLHSETCP
jgi:WD40 repeat protein